jgi:hypothetical protein
MNLLYKLIGEVERFFFAFSKTYHIKFPLPTALTQFSSLYPFLSDTRFFFSFFPFPCFFFSLSCAFSSTANWLFFPIKVYVSLLFSPQLLIYRQPYAFSSGSSSSHLILSYRPFNCHPLQPIRVIYIWISYRCLCTTSPLSLISLSLSLSLTHRD